MNCAFDDLSGPEPKAGIPTLHGSGEPVRLGARLEGDMISFDAQIGTLAKAKPRTLFK